MYALDRNGFKKLKYENPATHSSAMPHKYDTPHHGHTLSCPQILSHSPHIMSHHSHT